MTRRNPTRTNPREHVAVPVDLLDRVAALLQRAADDVAADRDYVDAGEAVILNRRMAHLDAARRAVLARVRNGRRFL